MRYKIMQSCRGCKQCYRACPVQAILTGPIRIDESKCISCGKCYETCPSRKVIEIK